MLHSRLSPRSLSWKLRFLLKPGTLHADFSFSLKKRRLQGIGTFLEKLFSKTLNFDFELKFSTELVPTPWTSKTHWI